MGLEDAAAKSLNDHLNDGSNESLPFRVETQMESQEDDSLDDVGFGDDVPFNKNRKETKRALEFDGLADIGVDGNLGRLEKKRTIEVDLSDKKDDEKKRNIANKKKRNKRIKSDDMKSKPSASDKKRQEKANRRYSEMERKAFLKQLHAESQRLSTNLYPQSLRKFVREN